MERIIVNDSTFLDSSNFFPKRSTINTTGRKLTLAANYFRFDFLDKNKKTFYKYSVNFFPELPGDSVKLRATILGRARKEIMSILGNYIFNNSTLFSLENYPDIIEFSVDFNSQSYKINIKQTNVIDFKSFEAEAIYKKFFNMMLRKICFVQIRKNFFNPAGAKHLQTHKLEIWPGFNSSVNILNEGVLLNMNILYKVLRPETALDIVRNLGQDSSRNCNDLKEIFNDYFKGVAVLTRYNNDKIYIIDEVDLEKTPASKFETKEGPVSYLDYYKKKYGIKINVLDQPLLIHRDKKKNQEIHLIPELCYLTGLTDEMRSNFNLMKEMANITKGNAAEKMEESRQLINQFLQNKDCSEEMKKWGLTINNTPLNLTGTKINVGNCLMHKKQDGSRYSFNIDESNDIDRKIQSEMYSQPPLNSWVIFSTQKDENIANSFLETLGQVQSTFNYKMNKPTLNLVRSQNFKDWEGELSRVLNPNMQAVVLIIPGSRGKGQLYNELKKLLMGKYPIPSQIVLSGTLAKGKGIRSIVNKILIQICAKIGGEPWAVDPLPFTNIPTMVCGIDVFKSSGKASILGFTSTFNKTFTRYMSNAKVYDEEKKEDIIHECFEEAVKNFEVCNKIPPKHIIIIRDGISPSQIKTVCIPEINTIKNVLKILKISCNLTYVLLNKKTNLKLFLIENNKVLNAPPGTVVDTKVTSVEYNDFYMISAKSNQGLPATIHYQIIYDDKSIAESDFQLLMYKLCFLYYNWTGSIKVPAPCQYAKKLASLLGDKLSDKRNIFLPNSRFSQQLKSLYYL